MDHDNHVHTWLISLAVPGKILEYAWVNLVYQHLPVFNQYKRHTS